MPDRTISTTVAPSILAVVIAGSSEMILRRCLASLRSSENVTVEVVVCSVSDSINLDDVWSKAGQDLMPGITNDVQLIGQARSLTASLDLSSAETVAVIPYADYVAPGMLGALSQAMWTAGTDAAVCSSLREVSVGRYDMSYLLPGDDAQTLSVADASPQLIWLAGRLVGGKVSRRSLLLSALHRFGEEQHRFPDSSLLDALGFFLAALPSSVTFVPDRLYCHKLDKPATRRRRNMRGGTGDLMRTVRLITDILQSDTRTTVLAEYFIIRQFEALFDELVLHGKRRALAVFLQYRKALADTGLVREWTTSAAFRDHRQGVGRLLYQILRSPHLVATMAVLPPRLIRTLMRTAGFRGAPTKRSVAIDQLWRLHYRQIEVLQATATLCAKHSIPFFLVEGTLLGAARHRATIPWDDDLDIGMLRDDYERFLAIPSLDWPDEIRLWWSGVDASYHLPFAKVVSTKRDGFRNTFPINISPQFAGVRIDVFPIDKVAESSLGDLGRTRTTIGSIRRSPRRRGSSRRRRGPPAAAS